MDLSDFGLLVKKLRNNSVDESGNHWTRDTLSKAVHLTANQLGRLERGDRKYLDTQTLQLLAKSFNLTDLEHKEFLCAAVGLSDEELFRREDPLIQLNNLIAIMSNLQVPGYIIDVYSDIVAANASILNLFHITNDTIDYLRHVPAGFNLLRFIYSNEVGFKDMIGPMWREAATMAILEFRRSTLRYRHSAYFNYIIRTLLKERQFDIDWYSNHRATEHYDLTYEYFEYEHPLFGPIKYIATETIINTAQGDLCMIIYNPANSCTVSTFTRLIENKGNNVHRLANWPEKYMV